MSISSTFYVQIFHTKQLFSSYILALYLEKSCSKYLRTKNLRVKCSWNWPQDGIHFHVSNPLHNVYNVTPYICHVYCQNFPGEACVRFAFSKVLFSATIYKQLLFLHERVSLEAFVVLTICVCFFSVKKLLLKCWRNCLQVSATCYLTGSYDGIVYVDPQYISGPKYCTGSFYLPLLLFSNLSWIVI